MYIIPLSECSRSLYLEGIMRMYIVDESINY